MLIEGLEPLGPNDVWVLDRGYPASWLIQFLIERGMGTLGDFPAGFARSFSGDGGASGSTSSLSRTTGWGWRA